ncbi:arylsulfatase A-like enzyme [Prosthecobacter fusiformis]|uniref:Arylsulfatase A-like enzyme n=1 Tax=Prosthecobacter fusiformis TaxID=48464 RepID=A0A4R7SS26_9BACT|nr:sulfatase [Prosthecobacter fusiformis]TDU81804.1 arylsulfatase A-like enzyme [Prosthecobacter fusiformis]
MFRLLLLLPILFTSFVSAAERPNMILFMADDVSWDDLGCYGNAAARTPNLDKLAANGRRFDEAYLTASSCSPSRSSTITGRYPHNNGRASELHQPIAAHLPWFPRLLKDSGYYTALVGKHHMTSDEPAKGEQPQPAPFDHFDIGNKPGNKGGHATWVKTLQERPKDKPFFFWFASLDAHRDWDADKDWKEELYGPKHDPAKVIVPPFLTNDAKTRQDLASYYNEITRLDYFVGQVVAELEKQGALDNTLLLMMADNGRAFPRAKTRLHDSGMKTPFIAHWPAGIGKPGTSSQSLISTIDIAPTLLELAKVPAAPTMQGVSFAPVLTNPHTEVRKHAFSEHNWHDYAAHGRSVRSEGFILIRNNRPQEPWQGPADSVRSPSYLQLLKAREEGKLTPAQADVFQAPRPAEELYRSDVDPNQLSNLANDPDYATVKSRLAKLMDEWADQTGDSVPADMSRDMFDRETGESLYKRRDHSYRGTPPGWDRDAARNNAPGPR